MIVKGPLAYDIRVGVAQKADKVREVAKLFFCTKCGQGGEESENFADIINEWPLGGRERNDVHPFRPARIQKEAEGG